ncbi:MAG: hypothetical protein EKE20_06755, partial [Candidatus Symbiopectobacterium sp. Dall1.0]|nr:hypothetical protein [Candidatus Symbiopectobacterium sp. Dall1.0]
ERLYYTSKFIYSTKPTPHYPSCYGGKIPVEWFEGFLQGLLERGALAHARAIVIGYIGTITLVPPLAAWLKQVRASWPAIHIILDPVMGDTDCGYYVNAEINACYRDQVLPLATGLTPNAFELSCLSAMTLDSAESAIAAARSLLKGAMEFALSCCKSWSPRSGSICLTAWYQMVFLLLRGYWPTGGFGSSAPFCSCYNWRLSIFPLCKCCLARRRCHSVTGSSPLPLGLLCS